MLIKCPECGHDVSDKAISCPNCGMPLSLAKSKEPPKKKRATHMRLPNGFGRITELTDKKRRKPFRVMVSVGKDEFGHPIGKLLKPEAYFKTYNEAYKALVEYHANPYDFDNDMTMNELYERWVEIHRQEVSDSRYDAIRAAWKYCEEVIGFRFVQSIKTPDLRRLFDDAHKTANGKTLYPSDNTKKNIKYTISMMMDYAVEYGYVDRNYARDIRTGFGNDDAVKPHIKYTDEEMKKLWSKVGESWVSDMIVFQCYSGLRPNELCNIDVSKVNMKDWSIICGSKTEAGKNREVPIHEKIRPILQRWYTEAIKSGMSKLFFKPKYPISYEILKVKYKELVSELKLNPDHRPHDGRKHFITMAKEAGVDEYAIKLIVGHRIMDITERVYTARNIIWLHKELGKIKQ